MINAFVFILITIVQLLPCSRVIIFRHLQRFQDPRCLTFQGTFEVVKSFDIGERVIAIILLIIQSKLSRKKTHSSKLPLKVGKGIGGNRQILVLGISVDVLVDQSATWSDVDRARRK